MVELRSFILRFYERHNTLVRETHLILKSQNLKVSEGQLLSLETVEMELYRCLDNSQYIKHRVDIEKSIFSHTNFNMNKMISSDEAQKIREQEIQRQRRIEDLKKIDNRLESRRANQNGENMNHLAISRASKYKNFRRRSMTIDAEALVAMRKNFYRKTRLSKAGSQEGLACFNKSSKVKKAKKKKKTLGARAIFFLINFFNSNQEFKREDDFKQFFSGFYFNLKKNFTEFKVGVIE